MRSEAAAAHSSVMNRWAEHFKSVLNQSRQFDSSVLDDIPQWDTEHSLMDPISLTEVQKAIDRMSSGKSPGQDGLQPELFKAGGDQLTARLTSVFHSIWQQRAFPQDFKDALMVYIFKRKGDHHTCDDHLGIALLSIPGKILARVIASRLTSYVEAHGVLPESQCGFRAGRSTTDMTFTVRQIQEKCREQQREMFAVFVDLSKAFDSVHRPGLWAVLRKIGCPPAFVDIIRSLHDGMMAAVVENGECSPEFEVTNGTKQGCIE